MAYESKLLPLYEAVKLIIAATRCSTVEAQTDICAAIADGAIRFRAKLKRYQAGHSPFVGTVVEGSAFKIPDNFDPNHLNWTKSCPLQLWLARRGHFERPGYWELEQMELLRQDILDVLCNQKHELARIQAQENEPSLSGNGIPRPLTKPALTTRDCRPIEGSQGPEKSTRRRGPLPTTLERIKEEMRKDLRRGLTISELDSMLEKVLAEKYGVSRDTARKARAMIVSEFRAVDSSTNYDKQQKATSIE